MAGVNQFKEGKNSLEDLRVDEHEHILKEFEEGGEEEEAPECGDERAHE